MGSARWLWRAASSSPRAAGRLRMRRTEGVRDRARAIFMAVHRWSGLAAAGFLIVAGLSGAVLAWGEPLDRALNPDLFRVMPQGQPINALELRGIAERAVPFAE